MVKRLLFFLALVTPLAAQAQFDFDWPKLWEVERSGQPGSPRQLYQMILDQGWEPVSKEWHQMGQMWYWHHPDLNPVCEGCLTTGIQTLHDRLDSTGVSNDFQIDLQPEAGGRAFDRSMYNAGFQSIGKRKCTWKKTEEETESIYMRYREEAWGLLAEINYRDGVRTETYIHLETLEHLKADLYYKGDERKKCKVTKK